MPDVFISHSSKNDTLVTEIHDALEKLTSVEIWVDHKDIAADAKWEIEIEKALRACPYLLVAISRESVKSDEVRSEWRAAITYGHKLLLVAIDDIPFDEIPPRLLIHQIVKWSDGGAAKIAAAINGDTSALTFTASIIARDGLRRDLIDIPMLGRDLDLAEAQNLVKEGVLQILGVGGRGKSRLAAEMMLHLDGVSGALWHECSHVSRPDEVIELLRDHFGLPITAERRDVLARLRERPRLIVLDNGESVKEGDERRKIYADLVESLAAAKARVVLTSRVEWEEIQPPRRKFEPRQLDDESARQVTLEMMKAFGVSGLESRASEIAKEARNHPGLIRWAVGQIERSSIARVLGDLHDLRGNNLQKALDGMILKTLHEMEESDDGKAASWVLKRVNVCRGGFTFDAATAICIPNNQSVPSNTDSPSDAAPSSLPSPLVGEGSGVRGQILTDDALDDALRLLQTYRFVTFDPAAQRYAVNTLAQEVIGDDPTAYNPHYDYYRALARQHHEKQDYLGLDIESDNLETAFERAFEAGDYERAYWIAYSCTIFLANRGRFEQRKSWFKRIATKLIDHPDEFLKGSLQNNLGLVYGEHPTGNRQDNLRRAITAYAQALIYWTPQSTLAGYAATQNNLGTAYADLAQIEDRALNVRRAIAAYEQALIYWTPQAAPLDYAMTQNNLGAAYRNLSEIEDRADNLRRAIEAYEQALIYRTPQAAPLDYAMTQNNLGAAYQNLAQIEDRAVNLRRAITAYEQALIYWTPQAAPLDYAMTRYNMALTYGNLAQDGDREANLKQAIAAYQDALRFRTPESAPIAYANTQWNLGITYEDLGDINAAVACWREAERVYRLMDMSEDADTMARMIANANLP